MKFGWVLYDPLKSEDVISPSSTNFVREVRRYVLFINSDQKFESLDLENKFDCFRNLESIDISNDEKDSQEHFTESTCLKRKISMKLS